MTEILSYSVWPSRQAKAPHFQAGPVGGQNVAARVLADEIYHALRGPKLTNEMFWAGRIPLSKHAPGVYLSDEALTAIYTAMRRLEGK